LEKGHGRVEGLARASNEGHLTNISKSVYMDGKGKGLWEGGGKKEREGPGREKMK